MQRNLKIIVQNDLTSEVIAQKKVFQLVCHCALHKLFLHYEI